MEGKVCIVTGANSGIGFGITAGLLERGATVIMACRDQGRAEAALEELQERAYPGEAIIKIVDLSSQASIRAFAEDVRAHFTQLDVLVNNAAVFPRRRECTEDGLELQFAVNHLAYFLLTSELLDLLKSSAPARIVNVSSTLHRGGKLELSEPHMKGKYSPSQAYKNTKLANVMFTYALARRLEGSGVTVNAMHPGAVRTNNMRHLPLWLRWLYKPISYLLLSPERGAETALYLASSPQVEGVNGKYFYKKRAQRTSAHSYDVDTQERLWRLSEELTAKSPALPA